MGLPAVLGHNLAKAPPAERGFIPIERFPMQTNNKLLDDLARVASGALGVASGMRDELEGVLRQRFARVVGDLNVVDREEFEAVKAMAAKARGEQEALAVRVAALEAQIKKLSGA
jgi:BMFP domain-containing protein YqiC